MFDSPWPILIAGVTVEVVLLLMLLRSGRGVWLATIAAVAVLTMALVAVERLVVTPREEIEATLDSVALAVEHNDLPAVLDFIAPSATNLRQRVEATLPHVKISQVHIGGDLTIEIHAAHNPSTAVANFTGRVNGRLSRGELPYENFVRHFRVGLQKDGERWLIVTAEDSDLRK